MQSNSCVTTKICFKIINLPYHDYYKVALVFPLNVIQSYVSYLDQGIKEVLQDALSLIGCLPLIFSELYWEQSSVTVWADLICSFLCLGSSFSIPNTRWIFLKNKSDEHITKYLTLADL